MSNKNTEIVNESGIPIFNPLDLSKMESTQNVVWTSESVALYDQAILRGDPVSKSPYNKRIKGFNLRDANLSFYTSDEEQEMMLMAMQDKILFGNNFIELKDPIKGEWTKVTLRNYQEKLLNKYETHNWHILKFPRQAGKTTTTIVDIVNFLTFNYDKDCIVVAQSDNVVSEILSKIKSAFSALPFFMQPGVIRWSDSEGEVEFDNGCRLKVGIASESVFQGFTLDYVFIDEFAYIPESRVHKFWINLYPALKANPNSKCIIASTPNGRNKFYELWQKAVKGKNSFLPSHIHWTDVPRPQNLEEFKQEVIDDIGLEGWLMGYECSFDTQLKSIFNTKTQVKLREQQNLVEEKFDEYWQKDDNYNIWLLNKDKFSYDLFNDYFVIGIDIGEGLGEDYSVMKIRKAYYDENEKSNDKKIKYKLVGVFHDNTYSVQEFAENFMNFINKNMNIDNVKVVVENNNYGAEFFLTIKLLRLNDNGDSAVHEFDDIVFAEFWRDSKENYEKGVRWDKANKKTAVRNYKTLVGKNQFEDSYPDSIDESMNFGRLKNGSYAAQYGHDDLTMADVTLSYYIQNPSNDNFISDLKFILNPIQIEIKKKEEEKLANKFVYTTPQGFTIRNHKKAIRKNRQDDSNFIFMNKQGNKVNLRKRNRAMED